MNRRPLDHSLSVERCLTDNLIVAKATWRLFFADPFADLSETESQLIKEMIRKANRNRAPLVLAGLSIWFAGALILDFVIFLPRGNSYYLVADLIILPITFAALFAATSREKTTAIYIAILLSWAGVVSALQGSPLTLFILAFLVSATILLVDASATAIYTLALASYTGAMVTAHGTPLFYGTTLFIEVVALSFAAWLVSRVLFRARVRAFVAESGLQALAREQEFRIAEATEAIRVSNSELGERLREREVLLREVHHRVMNNLQILVSLLRLAAQQSGSEGSVEVLRDTERRTLVMALVHEHLYANDNIAFVDMKAYLHAVAHSAVDTRPSLRPFEIAIDAEAFRAPAEIALNLGLIAAEALSLSLAKAAQKNESCDHLTLRCRHEGNTIELQISDGDCGGGGIDAFENGPSLGEILMRTLTDQLRGELSVETSDGILVTCRVPYPTSPSNRSPACYT